VTERANDMADLGEAGGLGRAVGTFHLGCGHRERGDPDMERVRKGKKGNYRANAPPAMPRSVTAVSYNGPAPMTQQPH